MTLGFEGDRTLLIQLRWRGRRRYTDMTTDRSGSPRVSPRQSPSILIVSLQDGRLASTNTVGWWEGLMPFGIWAHGVLGDRGNSQDPGLSKTPPATDAKRSKGSIQLDASAMPP